MTAEEIRAWRERSGITQEQAAALLGVSWETYRSFEPGRSGKARRPVPTYIAKLVVAITPNDSAALLIPANSDEAVTVMAAACCRYRKQANPLLATSISPGDIQKELQVALNALSDEGIILCRKKSA